VGGLHDEGEDEAGARVVSAALVEGLARVLEAEQEVDTDGEAGEGGVCEEASPWTRAARAA